MKNNMVVPQKFLNFKRELPHDQHDMQGMQSKELKARSFTSAHHVNSGQETEVLIDK